MKTDILLNQFYIYFVLIMAGFLSSKAKVIHRQNSSFLAGFILNITFPLLIFTTITHLEINAQIFKNLIFVFVASYFSLALLYIAGQYSGVLLKLSGNKHRVHVMHSMFGNIVFIGFPFIGSLFPGGEGILYAAVFQLAADSILWTFGIVLIKNSDSVNKKEGFRHLLNINTIVFFLSIICLFLGFHLPPLIESPFAAIGHTTIVLALIYVGYILSGMHFKSLFKEKAVIVLSINKLFIVPVLVLLALFFFKSLFPFLSNTAVTVIVLQTGMPAMATVAILARRYKSDEVLAGQNIFFSTILSILSLPLLLFVINIMLNRA